MTQHLNARASTVALILCGVALAVGCSSSGSDDSSDHGGSGGAAGTGGHGGTGANAGVSSNAGTGTGAAAGRSAGGSGGTSGGTSAGGTTGGGGAAAGAQGGELGEAGIGGTSNGDGGAAGEGGAPTCTPGATRCASSTQVQSCTADGQWGAASACTFGCGGNVCLTDYAMQFDGTDDVVHVPYAPSFDVTTAMTLEAWVYVTSASGGAVASMWGAGGLADKFLVQFSGGNVVARIVRESASGQTTVQTAMPLNAWTHVAFTYDGATMVLYLNGLPAASLAAAGALPAANLPFRMGIEDINLGVKSILDGSLDEVRFWNVARSAAQISTNYQQSISPTTAGLLGYWNFNEALTSQTVADATAGGHDGTRGADALAAADDPTRVAR